MDAIIEQTCSDIIMFIWDPNMPMNGENVYVVNHIFPSELNGNTGYKFYYNPGNGDIYNNWRYAFY